MPTAYGGQSQQRWGDNTLNKQESMRDVQMMDTSGKVCSTGDARRKGMLVLAFLGPLDSAASALLLPILQKLADAYKESGKLTVWAVSEEGETATAAYAKRENVTIPMLLDREAYHAMTYGITNFPTTFLADGSGIIQRKIIGHSEFGFGDVSAKVAAFAGAEPVDLFAAAATPPQAATAASALTPV